MSGDFSQFNLLHYFLSEERLLEIGDRTAIEFRDSQITYNELRAEVAKWARRIVNCEVREGDRVALSLYDSIEFVACFLATASIGAIVVPINTFLPAHDIEFILSDCGARLLIVESELEDKVGLNDHAANRPTILKVNTQTRTRFEQSDVEIDARSPRVARSLTTRDTPAFLLYTSGSTGTPKGVLHNHGSIPFTVEGYADNVLHLTSEDRVFSSSRMFFAYGLGNSLSFPLAAGATVILEPERMSAERLAKFIEDRNPTVFFGVPGVYLSLLEYRWSGGRVDLSGVRLCVSAGEALPAKISEDWQREFGLTILDGIGSTEMLHIFISNREGNSRSGSSGTVVEGYEARLVDDSGAEVGANELGNLWVRGDSAMAGYWNLPDLTEQTISDGWVRTGDIYRRDEAGFFHHIGRSDDCFKSRGMWVSPIEVESVLISHESVSEAAVVSSIDENGLATALAYVVIRQGEPSAALGDEICKFAGSRLPKYKVPSRIEFINEMPRTSTGKIQRYKLRAEGPRSRSGGSDD
ncbi:MAG TPA: benzoate-CoA ligase family protein [Blastocatellia bacterium]|nr:benzoate-CoA ligase family protein [Blastocatellia bacterium]